MTHYLVSWENYRGEYRSLIVYAESPHHAKALVKAAYPKAKTSGARKLKVPLSPNGNLSEG